VVEAFLCHLAHEIHQARVAPQEGAEFVKVQNVVFVEVVCCEGGLELQLADGRRTAAPARRVVRDDALERGKRDTAIGIQVAGDERELLGGAGRVSRLGGRCALLGYSLWRLVAERSSP